MKSKPTAGVGGGGAHRSTLPPARVLHIGEELIIETWRALRDAARLGCEATVRWAGPAFQARAPEQIVTTVLVPAQRIATGCFEVPHAATRAMGDVLFSNHLVNLAQLHTHPTKWVRHSDWDDTHAYSSRAGALSIVWPSYGRVLPAFDTWGVHQRQNDEWLPLTEREKAERIHILPTSIDMRRTIKRLYSLDDEDSTLSHDTQEAESRTTPARDVTCFEDEE
jgi:hypothetical protein